MEDSWVVADCTFVCCVATGFAVSTTSTGASSVTASTVRSGIKIKPKTIARRISLLILRRFLRCAWYFCCFLVAISISFVD